MRPALLLPGDLLAYRSAGDVLGRLISAGQWAGAPGEQDSYVHVGQVYNSVMLVRQNPGGPASEVLDSQPWNFIDVYRLDLSILLTPGVPQPIPSLPGSSDQFVGAFYKTVARYWGDDYDYGQIGKFLSRHAEAQLGGAEGVQVSRKVDAAGMLATHRSVCSSWAVRNLEETIRGLYLLPGFDLFPELAPGEERPADMTLSKYLVKVS
jgi:hypothetical protein